MWKLKIGEGSSPWLRSVNGHVGRQVWEFDQSLGSPEELAEIEKLREQFHNHRFEKQHSSDLLMRYQVIALSITGALNAILSKEHTHEMCRYLYNHLNRDGGWGLHIEGSSTMFGSVLSYVTLRLLGEGANDGDGAMENARMWILDHGGATAITSWGKMWLSLLGVFEWAGNNPLPPEIWLLPYILPFHPESRVT